eukprot:6763332-Alexandrium_andersonii.AAC.1
MKGTMGAMSMMRTRDSRGADRDDAADDAGDDGAEYGCGGDADNGGGGERGGIDDGDSIHIC